MAEVEAEARGEGAPDRPRQQLDLIRAGEWDILLVLDACRADYFVEHCQPCEVVRSPFIHTPGWIHRVGPTLLHFNALYFTANPVVNREARRREFKLDLVNVWEDCWGRHTELNIPQVHPWSVNAVVQTYAALDRLRGRRVVVHYMQPHSPYIGDKPLALSRWGGGGGGAGGEFGEACHKLANPGKAIRNGVVTWQQIRDAYIWNLALVWQAASQLADQLPGRVVITADHGELLGEDEHFGHEGNWLKYEELWRVPWLEWTKGLAEAESVNAKLEALGYV